MMKFYFLFVIFLFVACSSKSGNENKASLPDFFEPFNWEVTNKIDTSYLFFSPVHANLVEVFQYKIVNGDSVDTQQNAIGILDDSLRWKFNNSIYTITGIDSNKISLANKNTRYNLNKISDSLMFLGSMDDSFYFRRTLPISTFLVRKKDDYLKGTSGADSAEVLPRKLRKQTKH